ncbi:something about silencing protein 10 isoform X4 [Mobula birostris]|uniref:something about silencing protein 10 isoform X4 n=1 Tax=Mobula birostris TaxID=1983395 RepID=UPI003B283A14
METIKGFVFRGEAFRRKPRQPQRQQQDDDSDDPKKYSKLPKPDINSSEYYNDDVDEFHEKKFEKLLAGGLTRDNLSEDSLDEEEVMPLDLPDSDDEDDDEEEAEAMEEDDEDEYEEEVDMDSDLEGKSEEGLPSALAWGQKKKSYYNTDYVDELPRGKKQAEALAEAEEEEQEAINIQKRLAENLSEDDFGLDLIQTFAQEQEAEKASGKDLKIKKDLNKMSQKEKLKLLKKESPELLELIQDFKAKLVELKDELQPLMELVQSGRIPAEKDVQYVQTKYHLYLNYCTNISFYLVLKAKRIPVQNHPVIERLLSYRNVTGEEMSKDLKYDMGAEAGLLYHNSMKDTLPQKRKMEEDSNENTATVREMLGADEKRKITYQIAKNKGLTPKRKKIDRNPRVKHREKFRRAKIRRKGQVREVRREEQRYSGELSGIRAGVKKSIKLH